MGITGHMITSAAAAGIAFGAQLRPDVSAR